MHTYVRLKDGRIMKIWSDNTREETMNLLPIDGDAEFDVTETVNYQDIANIDTNLAII